MDKLKGKNRIRKFNQIAKRLASKISSYEGVAGIVFLGGLVRGFADKFSDLDITVFLSERNEKLRTQIYNIGLDEQKRSNIDIDLEVYFLKDFKRWKWNETDRWDFARAEIVFDREGETEKVFREKLKLPKDFWVKRIVVCAEHIKWHCCPSKENVGTIAEAWIDRGDLLAAHYCLTYSIDLMLTIIFALNKEFLPVQKWRIYYSQTLKWLPADYMGLLREAMIVREPSRGDLERRLKVLQRMWREVLPKIKEETGLTAELISKYYVEKVLHQSPPSKS